MDTVNRINNVSINNAKEGYSMLKKALNKEDAALIFPSLAITAEAVSMGLEQYQQTKTKNL